MTFIYFDHNSTSIIDSQVSHFISDLLKAGLPLNPSSTHSAGRKARSLMENARKQIAKSLNFDLFKDNYKILFTSCGTESNAIVLKSFHNYQIFCGATEHISILNGSDFIPIPVDINGLIEFDHLEEILKNSEEQKLISIMLANNETGVIQDIKKIAQIIHQNGALLHCDASQAFGKINFNIKDFDCDLLTISSHKCGGPHGASALIYKNNLNLLPLMKGGKQELGLRPGTENVIAIAGFGLAAEIIDLRLRKFQTIEKMRNYLEQSIEEFAKQPLIIAKNVARLPNTSSIRMPNVKSEQQLIEFDLNGIMLSAGSACSSGRIATSHVLSAMGLENEVLGQVIRLSLGPENNQQEIEIFINLWQKIYKKGQII